MPNTEPEVVHVAVGVVFNDKRQILIAHRNPDRHQGGLWEFPGGKLEAGESVRQALIRELQEEVHILVSSSVPLIRIPHDYGDKKVLLDVLLVTAYTGEAAGKEGQVIRWVELNDIHRYKFPTANLQIIEKLEQSGELLLSSF